MRTSEYKSDFEQCENCEQLTVERQLMTLIDNDDNECLMLHFS